MPRNPKADRNLRRPSTPGPCVTAVVSLGTTLIFALSRLSGATTVNASSASQSDVAAAVASAADGDTVTIPAGTASWTRTLVVRKAITIQGAGVGVTIIKDSVQGTEFLKITLVAGMLTRVTGIEFQDGGRTQITHAGLHIDGKNTDGSQFRMDHCNWYDMMCSIVPDTVIGVFDHIDFKVGAPNKSNGIFVFYGSRWDGGEFGDGSWAKPAGFGSSQFTFVEDCTITAPAGHLSGLTDAYAGARFVIRHNRIIGAITHTHGTESTGRPRSSRAMEIYDNYIDGHSDNRFVGSNRGGAELFYNNTLVNFWGGLAGHVLTSYHMTGTYPTFGGGDGTNGWDKNNSGNPFYSGTVSAVSGSTVSVSGTSWSNNQWAGYSAKKNSGGFVYIESNTSNSFNFKTSSNVTFSVGDSFVINKVDQCIDQPGAGSSTLISGYNVTPPPNWTQGVEPCYIWNNTNDGAAFATYTPDTLNIKQGTHYFNNTPMPGYTPYVYPHPLTKGLPPPEQMTRNVKGNSQDNLRKERQPWGGKKLDRKKAKKANESPTN
ncbi:MAG TPA: hypothetical protein VFH87_12755 [Candidatus Udaeobacter sp.]|nr:hypothetical protein [Candidatus Udaeobacter sp.]